MSLRKYEYHPIVRYLVIAEKKIIRPLISTEKEVKRHNTTRGLWRTFQNSVHVPLISH